MELTIEQRIHRLENFAICLCYRCRKPIPFNEAQFIPQPSFPNRKLILCYSCHSMYEAINCSKGSEFTEALLSYLNEKRPQK